jgi:hypothetical protein
MKPKHHENPANIIPFKAKKESGREIPPVPIGSVTSFEVKGMGKFRLAALCDTSYEKKGIESIRFAYVSEDKQRVIHTTIADPHDPPDLRFSKSSLKRIGVRNAMEFVQFVE